MSKANVKRTKVSGRSHNKRFSNRMLDVAIALMQAK